MEDARHGLPHERLRIARGKRFELERLEGAERAHTRKDDPELRRSRSQTSRPSHASLDGAGPSRTASTSSIRSTSLDRLRARSSPAPRPRGAGRTARSAAVYVPCRAAELQLCERARAHGEGQDGLLHERVEEVPRRHGLEIHEDGERASPAVVRSREQSLEVVEEARLPDPSLARQLDAVRAERLQCAPRERLAAEEELPVEHGRSDDVGVETSALCAPPPHPARDVVDVDQCQRSDDSRL